MGGQTAMRDEIATYVMLQNASNVDLNVELIEEKALLTVTMLKHIMQMSTRLPSSCITMNGVHIY
jgi:hypothetical protein